MECSLERGVVESVKSFPRRQELVVKIGEKLAKAINYPELTGFCQPGDHILLNTTAQHLGLGTGGWHYVLAGGADSGSAPQKGHIMKLRYTPLQGRVLAVEEEDSPYHQLMVQADSLQGLPVAVGSLHSMLAPLVWTLKQHQPQKRIAYLMSDGGALPLGFSQVVSLLVERKLIHKTITFGHAFGGDLEAVNVYSALLAAKHVARADLAIVLMGPGVVGTGTTWGTTAMEQGVFLNAVIQLGGTPIAIARMSEVDTRQRHRGLSHHTQTVLRRIAQDRVFLPLPHYFRVFPDQTNQLHNLEHKLIWEKTEKSFDKLFDADLPFSTMGRGLKDDPLFFHAVLAAARFLARF